MAGHYTPTSLGYTPPPAPDPGPLPPGSGRWAVPHQFSFASIYYTGRELYRSLFDEAVRHSRVNALAMLRDCVIWHALRARQMPTVQLAWHIDPVDETRPAEVEAAAGLTRIIENMPRWQMFCMALLEAVWYGRSAAQVVYRWDYEGGSKKLLPVDHVPVNGDKLRFHWDGSVGLYVHAMFPGATQITDQGMAHFLTPDERQQFIVHRHEPCDADAFEGEFASQIFGVGLRSRLYWFWWLKTNIYALMVNYLERFANGLTVVSFDGSNKDASDWADSVCRDPFSRLAVKVPRWPQDGQKPLNDVTRLEVGTAPPTLMLQLVTEYFDQEIRRAILGQDLSSDTAPTGLGSGVAEAHTETLSRIIKYDAVNLQDTIQTDLIQVLCRWNYPGVRCPKFSFEVDDPNTSEILGAAQILFDMGAEIDLDHLRKIIRLPKPKPGADVASKMGMLQASAVQSAPAGMPMSEPGGPAPGGVEGDGGQMPVPSEAALAYSRRSGRKTFSVVAN